MRLWVLALQGPIRNLVLALQGAMSSWCRRRKARRLWLVVPAPQGAPFVVGGGNAKRPRTEVPSVVGGVCGWWWRRKVPSVVGGGCRKVPFVWLVVAPQGAVCG